MFKFLKDKLKSAISKLGKKAEEEASEEIAEEIEEKEEEIEELKEEKRQLEKKEKKESSSRQKEKNAAAAEKKPAEKEQKKPEPEARKKEKQKPAEKAPAKEKPAPAIQKTEEPAEEKRPSKENAPEIIEIEKEIEEKKQEKKGFFSRITERITKTKISADNFEKLFWELEVALLESSVAVEVIEKVKADLKKCIVDQPVQRGGIEDAIADALKKSITEVLSAEKIDLAERIKSKKEKPYVICFIGVNGSGKTTSIAKTASYLQKKGISCVIAAADTFRAAAIDQLQIHADKLGIKLVKHDYGADAAAVAFDAVKHAQAKGRDAVLIDTAGRMHSNSNLMDEMKKIVRVAKPDLKIFVGESIVGNDCVEQAKQFNDSIGIDAIILSKADVDEKGGAAVSISYVTKKPIIFIGTGQEYGDFKEFDSGIVIESLGL